jgi:hypothetical protein
MAQKAKKRSGKKRRGRPKTTGTGVQIQVRCHREFLERVDKWRASQGDITRPDALRRLAEIGLDNS